MKALSRIKKRNFYRRKDGSNALEGSNLQKNLRHAIYCQTCCSHVSSGVGSLGPWLFGPVLVRLATCLHWASVDWKSRPQKEHVILYHRLCRGSLTLVGLSLLRLQLPSFSARRGVSWTWSVSRLRPISPQYLPMILESLFTSNSGRLRLRKELLSLGKFPQLASGRVSK